MSRAFSNLYAIVVDHIVARPVTAVAGTLPSAPTHGMPGMSGAPKSDVRHCSVSFANLFHFFYFTPERLYDYLKFKKFF